MMRSREVLVGAALVSVLLCACGSKNGSGDDSDSDGGITINPNGPIGSEPSTDPNAVGSEKPITTSQASEIRDGACAGFSFEPESSPGKLEVIVDISSSMNEKAPGSQRSKWEETRDALLEAIVGVKGPGLASGTAVGLFFYPNMIIDSVQTKASTDPNMCLKTDAEIPMAVLGGEDGEQRTLLRGAISDVQLGRGTPTLDAYQYALNNTVLGPNQALPGDSYMLLITDGMPTLSGGCFNPAGELQEVDPQPIVKAVEAAAKQNVRTFIIGSPGSESGRSWLSHAASLGGTGAPGCKVDGPSNWCHMDMTTAPNFSEALRQGLSQVASQLGACKFRIPATSEDGTAKIDPNRINPMLTFSDGRTVLVARDNANGEDCALGFRLVSETQFELCKTTCDSFLADPKSEIELLFGCDETRIDTVIE